jgi:glutaminyl-peptide cyclotransferase
MATTIFSASSASLACRRLSKTFAVGLLAALVLGACDRARTESAHPSGKKIWEDFSGDKALAHVQAMVDFGPRPPGTEAIEKTRTYLAGQLEAAGWKVERQNFSGDTPRGKMQFVNVIATFGSQSAPSFLVCSHYDTKIFDNARFVGANDGGSSTGVLLEVARVLAERPDIASKIELVFFDGEEAYDAFTETDGIYGSRYFAKQLVAQDKAKLFRGGMLFDMVGDKSLTVTLPPDSPPELARDVFASADALKLRKHFTYFDRDITDDHTPLNEAGIPVIDLIDFDYPSWHTPDDTVDKLSAESLRITGSVACYFLSEFAFK